MDLDLSNAHFDADESQWLTAYADLISAVLAVVVLMLTFAPVDMEGLAKAVSNNTGAQIEALDDLMQRLEQIAQSSQLNDQVDFRYDYRGLHISLGTVSLFAPDSDQINAKAAARFIPLLEEIVDASNYRHIDLEGHTDDTGKAERNWQLSSMRAYSMRRYLKLLGFPDDGLRLIALANTDPQQPIDNLDGEDLKSARQANRRIVLRIHSRKPSDME